MPARKISAGLGAATSVAATVCLAGWVADEPRLTDWAGVGVSMQPNSAVAAAALGAGLVFLATGLRRAAWCAVGLTGALGGLTLLQYVAGVDLGIDRLLLFGRPWGNATTLTPGRMGPPSALAWTLLAASVWWSSRGPRGRSGAVVASIVVMLLAALASAGYLYGVEQFYALPAVTAVSLPTAALMFTASAGVLFSIPAYGFPGISGARDDAGGVLLRRMVVPVFLVPLVFGWIRLEGERMGLYDAAFGEAAFVIFTTAALLALLLMTARHMGQAAAATEHAAHTQRVLARIGELAAKVRDRGNLLEAISETVAKALDVSRCGFSRVDLETGQLTIERDYHGEFPSLAGTTTTPRHWGHIVSDGRAGRPTVVRDVRRDPAVIEEVAERYEKLPVRSHINVPLHRDGKWVANFFVAHHEPRNWADHEVELMTSVAERAWLVMEKARAVEEQRAALRALAEREATLREADRRKNEFLATLAHELRNPLAPVVTALELIKGANGNLELIERCRVMMERQLGHTVRLVDDLLDVSRLTRDSIELRRERVDLESIVESAMEAVRPVAEETGHDIEVELPRERVLLHADPVRISQVLTNLLTNACKYTPAGGRIALDAERRGDRVEVRVTDSGIGISPDAIPSAFEIFSQLERPVASVPGGLGIGLSLVKSLVEKHGGTVRAHSDGPNRGTQFVVTLPLLAEEAPEDGPTEQAPDVDAHPAGTGRVLVVDDNVDAATTLAAMLAVSGYETEVTHDGTSAVEKAAGYTPAAILLDIGLPDMNGYEVCRAIREQPYGNDVRIVAVTGWGTAEDRMRSAEAGFDAHLVKPVSPATLLQTLSGLLAASSNGTAQHSA